MGKGRRFLGGACTTVGKAGVRARFEQSWPRASCSFLCRRNDENITPFCLEKLNSNSLKKKIDEDLFPTSKRSVSDASHEVRSLHHCATRVKSPLFVHLTKEKRAWTFCETFKTYLI